MQIPGIQGASLTGGAPLGPAVTSAPIPSTTPQDTQNTQSNTDSKTDKQALALTHAIALAETGGSGKPDYNAVGDNGTSFGAYQWNGPGKFADAAKSFGLDPNDTSPENQDKVAYAEIKAMKDSGLQPAQIAAKWNSGGINNWHDHSGTVIINGKAIHYDTPAYVQRVKGFYQKLNSQPSDITQNADGTYSPNPQYTPIAPVAGNTPVTPTPQPGINNGKGVGGLLTKLFKPELTAVGTGIRAIQSIPSTAKFAYDLATGNHAGAVAADQQSAQIQKTPMLGVNTAPGNSISQNLGLALQTAGQAGGFGAGALATQTAGSDINSGSSIPQTVMDTALTYGGAKGLELLSPYLAPLLAKGGSAAFEALPQAVQDLITTVAKSGTELKGAIGDALKPIFEKIGTPSLPGTNAISELSSKIPSAIKDYFGGEGTTQALMVKKATPGLVDAWQTGDRTAADVGDSLNSDFNAYKTQGIQKLQAVKNSLPDVAMPQSNIKGGINKIIEDETSNANTSEGDERTLKNLQNFLDRNLGNDTTSKGVLDLRTALDQGDYYVGDGQHNVSDAVVKKVRQYLNDTAIERMANYDTEYGTQYAPQLKKALADSSDSIKFQDKFKRNILGNNPNTYVEQTTNKVKKLINKSADPTEMENTKELLTEFENRIGQPGKYAKDFQAANAAKTLKGMGGRVLKKAGSLGLKAAIGGGLYEAGTNGLIGKLLNGS